MSFYGVKTYCDPPTYFQGVKTPNSQDLGPWVVVRMYFVTNQLSGAAGNDVHIRWARSLKCCPFSDRSVICWDSSTVIPAKQNQRREERLRDA